MKVLYLTIKFDWENINVHTDLIRALCEKGHTVTVVTCENSISKDKIEKVNDQLNILKVKTGNQFDKNLVKKGINMIILENKMILSIKRNISDEKFNLILYSTPPITFSNVVKYCKQKYKCKTYLALKDIFPQNAVDLNLFSTSSLIHKYFKHKEIKLYQYSDRIGCMSQGNIDFLLKNNLNFPENKLEIFPNSHIVRDFIINDETKSKKTTFIFGGNLGKPQGLNNLIRIINEMKDFDLAEFIIIGKGAEEKVIKNFIDLKKPSNLVYKEYLPKVEYDKYVNVSDVGLITLDTRFTIPNIPSKLINYLEMGKPVLAITDINTDLKDIIKDSDCGWWADGNDINNIKQLIIQICHNKETAKTKGLQGRNYFEKNLDAFRNVELLEKFINQEE